MKTWLGSILLLGVVVGCDYSRVKVGDDAVSGARFAVIQRTILQPKCMSCHTGPNAGGGHDLSSHAALLAKAVKPGDPEHSPLYESVRSRRMPKNAAPLADADVELIRVWIADGAPETEVPENPPPTNPQPTFAWISKNVFGPRCVVCHNTAKPRGKTDLSSYEGLKASTGNHYKLIDKVNPDKSGLVVMLVEQKMPPAAKKLTNPEMVALHEWIAKGAPEVTAPPPEDPAAPPQPTWEWLSKNSLRRCGSCHGIPFKVANIDFTSYATLLESKGLHGKPLTPGDPSSSGIYLEVISGHMPPPKKEVNADEVEVIRAWVRGGALNN